MAAWTVDFTVATVQVAGYKEVGTLAAHQALKLVNPRPEWRATYVFYLRPD